MSKALLAEMVEKLLSGEAGSSVAEYMRRHRSAFNTDCSMQSYVSRVRRMVLDSPDPRKFHASHRDTLSAFRARVRRRDVDPDCRQKARAFLDSTFRKQYHTMRRHARRKFCFGNPGVDEVFREIRMLPDSMQSFHPLREEAYSCRRQSTATTLRKNESVLLIRDASSFLDRAVEILRESTPRTSIASLGFALLLVSGRRTAEVFNGRSSFEPGPTAMSAIFTGQLKKRSSTTYTIPLLCTFSLFDRGMRALLEKQGDEELTNEEVHVKYASNLNKAIKSQLAPQATVHDCRRFYIQALWLGYGYAETTATFNRVAMQFLGHDTLSESLKYNNVRLLEFRHRFPARRIPIDKTAPAGV